MQLKNIRKQLDLRKTVVLTRLIVMSLSVGFALAGCGQHSNPLTDSKKHNLDASGEVLAEASYYGERILAKENKLSNLHFTHSYGAVYGLCQTDETVLGTATCQELYHSMLTYVRYQKQYGHTTLADITSPNTYKILYDSYEIAWRGFSPRKQLNSPPTHS